MKSVRSFFVIVTLAMLCHCSSLCQADNSTDPPGDVEAFRPIASLDEVSKFAGQNAKLVSLHALYVKSDGTMDLSSECPIPRNHLCRWTARPSSVSLIPLLSPGSDSRDDEGLTSLRQTVLDR